MSERPHHYAERVHIAYIVLSSILSCRFLFNTIIKIEFDLTLYARMFHFDVSNFIATINSSSLQWIQWKRTISPLFAAFVAHIICYLQSGRGCWAVRMLQNVFVLVPSVA